MVTSFDVEINVLSSAMMTDAVPLSFACKSRDLQANDNGTASVIIAEDKTFISTSNDVTTYGMGVFGVESDTAEAKWTSLYIHKGTKEARSITGFDPDQNQLSI